VKGIIPLEATVNQLSACPHSRRNTVWQFELLCETLSSDAKVHLVLAADCGRVTSNSEVILLVGRSLVSRAPKHRSQVTVMWLYVISRRIGAN